MWKGFLNLKPLPGKFDAKPGGMFLGIFTVSLNFNAKSFFFVNGFVNFMFSGNFDAQLFFRGKALIWEFHFCFREFRCATFFLPWKSVANFIFSPGILMHNFFFHGKVLES